MRIDQVDTLISQLEDFIRSIIHVEIAKSKGYDQMSMASDMILSNMRESLKEYLCDLLNLKVTNVDNLKCPECNGDMIQRRNKTNGDIFYGCRKYPNCKGTRDSNGLSRAEREEQSNRQEVSQQDGFSFNKRREPWNESGPNG